MKLSRIPPPTWAFVTLSPPLFWDTSHCCALVSCAGWMLSNTRHGWRGASFLGELQKPCGRGARQSSLGDPSYALSIGPDGLQKSLPFLQPFHDPIKSPGLLLLDAEEAMQCLRQQRGWTSTSPRIALPAGEGLPRAGKCPLPGHHPVRASARGLGINPLDTVISLISICRRDLTQQLK